MSDWTEAEQKILRERWTAGETALMILEHLPSKTRNAIIREAHRLNLP